MKKVVAKTRQQWRQWLAEHHDSESEVWLIFRRRHTHPASLSYDDAVEEALCFGWIDSIIKRIDEEQYARKFTPRNACSKWSTANRRRYAELQNRGLLTPAGLKRAPTERNGDAPRLSAAIPQYIERVLRADAAAWSFFERLAPSHRRNYIGWIDSAKRPETKKRRLDEAIALLSNGQKLGLK
jgi:uncharacterized protein YdeI (YjbR/CyaY-like superfamily)